MIKRNKNKERIVTPIGCRLCSQNPTMLAKWTRVLPQLVKKSSGKLISIKEK